MPCNSTSHLSELNEDKMSLPTIYQTEQLSYTLGKDTLTMQSEASRIIAGLIAGASELALRLRPSPKKWSVTEIIAHLAEDELVSSWRYRQMIENSGCTLAGFDQDKWARLGDYLSWNPWTALQMYRLLRDANVRMLQRLTEEEWERFGVHAERGKMTVRDLARHMAGHDMNHIEQIRCILHGF
jgi:DinB family protein